MSPVPLNLTGESDARTFLHPHNPHPHTPKNANDLYRGEQRRVSLYKRLNNGAALKMTYLFSTMELFWLLILFLAVWMVGNSIGPWRFDPMPFPLLLFLWNIPQLPLLPLLAIGQSLLGRKQELMAQESFETTQKSFHDIEEIMTHLSKQDAELLRQSHDIAAILSHIELLVGTPGEDGEEGTHLVRAHRRVSGGKKKGSKKITSPLEN